MPGFAIQNIDTSVINFLCQICSLLLRDPMQLVCGHRCCKSCIQDQQRTTIKCTQCHVDSTSNQMFLDRGVQNDMQKLRITCSVCLWGGSFKYYQMHLMRNHSNGLGNPRILKSIVLKVRKLLDQINECRRNIQLVRRTMQAMSDYPISIEEETPPRNIQEENDNTYVSYDGTLILKISAKQLTEPGSIITSLPFHTSPSGYKMCVRLYLNGKGVRESTHVSAYLILMRGDHDPILTWPFQFQVIFGLYDVINQKEHIVEAFHTDHNSTSFQQPQSDMNIPFGIPKFIPLQKLQQPNSPYICEGSVYIKVMIRKEPIPISILQDVMNIYHALPMPLQEEKIKDAIQKSQKSSLTLHLTLKTCQPC